MIHILGKSSHGIVGDINLPLSKSESNRYLILSALCNQLPVSYEISEAEDSQLMNSILNDKNNTIDCGKAGTVLRFLTALFSIDEGSEIVLTGDDRMLKRPVKDLVDSLREIGANIEYLKEEGYPPIKVSGKLLEGGKVHISNSTSSQFISALMLIAPKLKKGLEIIPSGTAVSSSYIELTAEVLKNCGVEVDLSSDRIRIPRRAVNLSDIQINKDWSSAAFWYQLVALADKGNLLLKGLSFPSSQGDSKLVNYFTSLGVRSEVKEDGILISKIEINGSKELEFNCKDCPDIVPSLVVTVAALGIKCMINGVAHLRIKESDRIAALETELKKFGVKLVTEDNKIRINNSPMKEPEEGTVINTYNDHRIAMAFAPLAMKFTPLAIENWEVVYKSYPNYWDDLKKFFLLGT